MEEKAIENDLSKHKKKKKKKKKELNLHQVEDLKVQLRKHLKELNGLFGKKRIAQENLLFEISSDSSEDDGDEINKQIAELKALIDNTSGLLKGEIGPEQIIAATIEEIDIEDPDADKPSANEPPEKTRQRIADNREQQRQEYIKERQTWLEVENKKFDEISEAKNESQVQNVELKKEEHFRDQQ